MNEHTVRALSALNHDFYATHAGAFSETRRGPWKGWDALLPRLRALAHRPLRVLDVGCGNGRFARYLAEALPGASLGVEGVDASAPLLDRARRAAPKARFSALDFAAAPEELPSGPFELVALFGVLHGVPGRETRRALLRACAMRVAAGGLLVFTVWRLGDDPRLLQRALRGEARAAGGRRLDALDLEPGDRLLPWGEGDDVVRYVHEFEEGEIAEIERALPLALETRYRADGPRSTSNEYLVLRRPAGA